MVITGRKVIQYMETIAPMKYAEEWDNVGFLIGNPDKKIKRILVALDAIPEVVKEAIDYQVDLIVTHHPFPFRCVKSICQDCSEGKLIIDFIKHDIGLYAAHTNLDIAFGGTNDVLAEKIGLHSIDILSPIVLEKQSREEVFKEEKEKRIGMGRIGHLLEPISLQKYAKEIRKKLNLEYIRMIGEPEQIIHKVAICTGSGMSYLQEAMKQNADVFITGDVKFHEAQKALQHGIAVIDAGHYGTEQLIIPVLAKGLRSWGEGKIEVMESKINGEPFQVII